MLPIEQEEIQATYIEESTLNVTNIVLSKKIISNISRTVNKLIIFNILFSTHVAWTFVLSQLHVTITVA